MRRPLAILAVILLVVLGTTALVFALGGEASAGSTALTAAASPAATQDFESPEAALFGASASGCTPPPVQTCTFVGQCCRCRPCGEVGTCGTLAGQLVCICPCAQ